MKVNYQFTSDRIPDCTHCPFYDPLIDEESIYSPHDWQCWINKEIVNDRLGTKPKWCPLKEVD